MQTLFQFSILRHSRQGVILLLLLLWLPTNLFAQYKMHSNLDFEGADGHGLPEDLLHGHNSTPFTTKVVAYDDPSLAGVLGDKARPDALGKFGISFSPLAEEPHLSVVQNVYLDRARLGTEGSALIQADFFLPPEGANYHTVALLASKFDPNYGKSRGGYQFYRFGLQAGRVFFSFTNATPTPVFFHRQDIGDFSLERPGWHRLQLAFHSDGKIFCYIDGNQTNFSPIEDQTLMEISPGLMVTRYNDSEGIILADNLSMLWSPTASTRVPSSPFTEGKAPVYGGAIQWDREGLTWYTNFSEAWHDSSVSNKHIFVFLYDTNEDANEYCLKLLGTPEAKAFLSFVVPLRVNMASDYGKQLAQHMGISDPLAFVVLKPDGTPFSEAKLVAGQTQWPDVQKALTRQGS